MYTLERITITSLLDKVFNHFATTSNLPALVTSQTLSNSSPLVLTMRPENQKKVAAHYGVLCGLRSDADSDPDDSTSSEPSPKQEPATPPMPPSEKSTIWPRPESLTLPFENRERESRLVTEEEFDRIIKQDELDNPLPPLPAGLNRGASGLGLRRSISTARNTRMSIMSQRARPMSADVSRMVPTPGGQRSQGTEPFPPLARDPTLTALPRAPTRNDLMGEREYLQSAVSANHSANSLPD